MGVQKHAWGEKAFLKTLDCNRPDKTRTPPAVIIVAADDHA